MGNRRKKSANALPRNIPTSGTGNDRMLVTLSKSKLFAGCETMLDNCMPLQLTYPLGAPIIRRFNENGSPDSALSCNMQVILPPNGDTPGKPLSTISGMESNPLFVVIKGTVEVHDTFVTKNSDRHTYPISIFNQGDVFGIFEFGQIENPQTSEWLPYTSDVTSGFRTVVSPSKFAEYKAWKHLTGRSFTDEYRKDLGLLLAESHKHLFKDDTEAKSASEAHIAVINKSDVLRMCKSVEFLTNIYNIMENSNKAYRDLNYPITAPNMRGMGNLLTLSARRFNTRIVPLMKSGVLPTLVPCTRYEILLNWTKRLHEQIFQNKRMKNVKLPLVFFVPAMGDKVSSDFQDRFSCKYNTSSPTTGVKSSVTRILSFPMLSVHTQGVIVDDSSVWNDYFSDQTIGSKDSYGKLSCHLANFSKFICSGDREEILRMLLATASAADLASWTRQEDPVPSRPFLCYIRAEA